MYEIDLFGEVMVTDDNNKYFRNCLTYGYIEYLGAYIANFYVKFYCLFSKQDDCNHKYKLN